MSEYLVELPQRFIVLFVNADRAGVFANQSSAHAQVMPSMTYCVGQQDRAIHVKCTLICY